MIESVQSAANLKTKFFDHFTKSAESAPGSAVRFAQERIDQPARRAIFAIHGISPKQRYAFQDQVALALQGYLNAVEQLRHSGLKWCAIVHWPFVLKGSGSQSIRPSALRIYRNDDNPDDPKRVVYDVYEGYWSPLSKGKTTIASALQWIFRSTFLATSSTANVPCSREKLFSDLGYVGGLLGLLLLLLLGAIVFGVFAWTRFIDLLVPSAQALSFFQLIRNPVSVTLQLPLLGYVELVVDLFAAFFLMQLFVNFRANREAFARTSELRNDAKKKDSRFTQETLSAQSFHRWATYFLWAAFFVALTAAGVIGAVAGHFNWANSSSFLFYALLVITTVGFLTTARSQANLILENVLGDIQIYTTHDQNLGFYNIRGSIIQTVSETLLGLLRSVDKGGMVSESADKSLPKPYYDAIHIFGHSLGSTVGMDVLISARQMIQEGLIEEEQWKRIRSFTTFGTALEKTRFFFDVRQPTVSAAQDQWKNDVYGRFFTRDFSTLSEADNTKGIFWSNIWYLRDIVANAIVSYTSDVKVGDSFEWQEFSREICENYELPHVRPRFAWVHSDYLNDPLFWEKVAPVIT